MPVPRQSRHAAVPLFLAATLALACSDSSGPDLADVSAVVVANMPDTLGAGDVVPLQAEARDASGGRVEGVRFEWRSLTPTLATVDGGVLRGLDSGQARIVVAALGRARVEDTIEVPVRRLPRSFSFTGLADTVWAGTRDTVTVVARDGTGAVIGSPIVLSSSDTTTFDVFLGGGIVRARAGGDAWLRAETRGFVDSVRVRVEHASIATPAPFVALGLSAEAHPTLPSICGLTAAGAAWCARGASPLATADFTQLPGGQTFRDVQGSQRTMCGLATDDRMFCWGVNHHGNLGTGSATPAQSATPLLAAEGRAFSSMALGPHALVCGIGKADSLAYCWGHNDFGQTGRLPVSQVEYAAAAVPGLPKVRQISAGLVEACAIAIDMSTWCWGGVFLPGNQTTATTAVQQVAAPNAYTRVATSNGYACGLTAAGAVECFQDASTTRFPVTGVPALTSLVNGSLSTVMCGVAAGGAMYCWQYASGQTGPIVGQRALRTQTVRAVGLGWRACAVGTNDRLYC
jgi:hypothetical protein